MMLSPSKSDQESKLIFDDALKATINNSYRIIETRHDKVYQIENCGSENLVGWGPDTVRDRLRIYVVGKNVTNSRWRLIPEKSDKDAYQIVEGKDGKNNLYLSSTFLTSTGERLAIIWTGTNESDWVGDENLRRVFTFEKFERDAVRLQAFLTTRLFSINLKHHI